MLNDDDLYFNEVYPILFGFKMYVFFTSMKYIENLMSTSCNVLRMAKRVVLLVEHIFVFQINGLEIIKGTK